MVQWTGADRPSGPRCPRQRGGEPAAAGAGLSADRGSVGKAAAQGDCGRPGPAADAARVARSDAETPSRLAVLRRGAAVDPPARFRKPLLGNRAGDEPPRL